MATTKNKKSPVSDPSNPAAPPAVSPPAAPAQAASSPDPNVGLAQYVQQAVASLDTIEGGLGADLTLTPTQKRHAAKLRKGGAPILTQIGILAKQQQLESPALSVDDMTTALGKVDALQPLLNRVAAFDQHIGDLIFLAQSQALEVGLKFYALLQRCAVTDAELATAMAPVTAFFAYRRPVTKQPGAPTKPQAKATAKAVKTLKKNAPALLQGPSAAPAATAAPATAPAPAAAPATGSSTPATGGNGAAGPATPPATSHS